MLVGEPKGEVAMNRSNMILPVGLGAAMASWLGGCSESWPVTFTFEDNGKTMSVAEGAVFDVKLNSIGPSSYGDPVVSTASVRFVKVEIVPPYNPGGPTQQFEFVAAAKGQATITIAKVNDPTGANPPFTLAVKVE
jgi:hypothetical protein